MARKPGKRIILAQNFLRSRKLVRSLLDAASITPADIVYEIGPGRGIITAELAQVALRVVAIEKDRTLACELHKKFQDVSNVRIIAKDFLRYHIADREYKIFASIPYNLTAHIVRRVLYVPPVPSDAYLIMQKEAAEKFSGSPRETQFSILVKPFFDIQILRDLKRTDFEPVPNVDSVLLQFKKRHQALVRRQDISLYRRFVRYGFRTWKNNLKSTFKSIFTYQQWKHLSKDLDFPLDAVPSALTLEQWLGLLECFQERVPTNKQSYLR
jgi:23S rRNA (adenine-N6)-dimethyltransferase